MQGKLQQLRSDPERADRIAAAGKQLAEKRYSWEKLGADVADALKPPLRRKVTSSILGLQRYDWEPPGAEN